MFLRSRNKLKNKFDLLIKESRYKDNDNQRKYKFIKEVTLNLCADNIPTHHKKLLDLGPNFVPIPSKVPYMDIINKDQFKALKELKSSNTISIYPFDKGSGFVRTKKTNALKKIEEQLGKSKIINYDQTQKLLRKVQNTLRNLETKFTKNEYSIYPSDATPPRLYGVIKAHKPTNNHPMRIIVSTIGSPTNKLSNYLANLIQPTSNLNKTKLRNSKQFVECAQSWYIDPGELQVSFDIVNLYPSIPVKESIDILLEQLRNSPVFKSKLSFSEIKILLDLCLSNCYFLHESNIHTLEDAGPIGLSLMVVMAESFLQHYEEKALLQAQYLTPPICVKSFKRYVDDIHSRFINEAESERFLNLLNNQHTNINYTIEKESDSHAINFLDLSITNNKSGTYLFKIYRKDAITNVQIKPHSCHNPKIIYGVFKGFIRRAFALCSKEHINHELKFLTEMFTENEPNYISLPWVPKLSNQLKQIFKSVGYTPVFKSPKNLQQLITQKNKPRLPNDSYPGVYKLECSCGKLYVGETKLKVSTRICQHQKHTFEGKWKNSTVAGHSRNCHGAFGWNNNNTVKVEEDYFKRKVRESLEIQFHQCSPGEGGLNEDDGDYVTSSFWKPYFLF
ncbi:uncharacterized protein LOC136085574 [Hydra vulgaris]|uniref:Uncharacterized protein LOC136085574 n=1 Tax=Hydra vulgaris TaxID=6087 RepID=A0ABM4CME6_HYDVU